MPYTIHECTEDTGFEIENGVLLGYHGAAEHVIVPDGVHTVGESAFAENGDILSVLLPEGVTEIGASAFSDCSELLQVVIPETVKRIGAFAFSGTKLREAMLPWGLVDLGEEGCFADTCLEKIIIPGTVKVIPVQTFAACRELKEVVLMQGVERIEWEAFQDCTALHTVTVPDSLGCIEAGTGVMEAAFAGCKALRQVKASDGWKQKYSELYNRILGNFA